MNSFLPFWTRRKLILPECPVSLDTSKVSVKSKFTRSNQYWELFRKHCVRVPWAHTEVLRDDKEGRPVRSRLPYGRRPGDDTLELPSEQVRGTEGPSTTREPSSVV